MINLVTRYLDLFTEKFGRALAVTPLALVLVQFSVVLLVYIFSKGSIKLQESLYYINGIMFLGGAGYTALHDDHVRVDLFYSKFSDKTKNIINLVGSLFLLIPVLVLLWVTAVPFAADSWVVFEGSTETGGLHLVYLLKSTVLLFAFTLTINAVSTILKLVVALFGDKS